MIDSGSASPPATSIKYPHTDRQGSVMAVTDSTGAVGERFAYDGFGRSSSALSGYPFRYTGQRLDFESGLMFYKARVYSTALGRFLQTDPIGTKDDLNLYAYVGNDPLNQVDPAGMAAGDLDCQLGGGGCQTDSPYVLSYMFNSWGSSLQNSLDWLADDPVNWTIGNSPVGMGMDWWAADEAGDGQARRYAELGIYTTAITLGFGRGRPGTAPKEGGPYSLLPKSSDCGCHHLVTRQAGGDWDLHGPAIRMTTNDHVQTASWGNRRGAAEFRAEQVKLVQQGRYKEAIGMGIADVRAKFGAKYESAITEMKTYFPKGWFDD